MRKKNTQFKISIFFQCFPTHFLSLKSCPLLSFSRVLDCRSGYVSCSEENLYGKVFVVMQPSQRKDFPAFPTGRAHSVHITDVRDREIPGSSSHCAAPAAPEMQFSLHVHTFPSNECEIFLSRSKQFSLFPLLMFLAQCLSFDHQQQFSLCFLF